MPNMSFLLQVLELEVCDGLFLVMIFFHAIPIFIHFCDPQLEK